MTNVLKNVLKKYILLPLLIGGGLIALALIVLTNRPGEYLLKGLAETQLTNVLGCDVRIGRLETNLFSRVRLYKVRIAQPNHIGTRPLAVFSGSELQYNLTELLSRRIYIESIDFDDLQVNLERRADGSFNLPEIFTESAGEPSGQPYQFTIRRLAMKNSRIIYEDQAIPLNGSLTELILDGTVRTDSLSTLIVSGGKGSITILDRPVPVESFRLNLAFGDGVVSSDSLMLALPGLQAYGSFMVTLDDSVSILKSRFTFNGQTTCLEPLYTAWLAPVEFPVTGRMLANLDISGPIDSLVWRFDLQAPELKLERFPITNGFAAGSYIDDRLTVDSLALETAGGKVRAGGFIRFDEFYSQSIKIQWEAVDLARLFETIYAVPSNYQGRVSGQSRTVGNVRDISSLTADASLSIDDLRFLGKSVPRLKLDVRTDSTIVRVNLSQGLTRLEFLTSLGGDSLKGTYQAGSEDIRLLAGLFDIPKLSGTMEASGTVRGTTRNPVIEGTAQGKNLFYAGFPINDISSRYRYANKKFNVLQGSIAGALAEDAPPPEILDAYKIQSGFEYLATFQGNVLDPDGQAKINLKKFRYQDWSIEKAGLQISKIRQRYVLEAGRINLAGDLEFLLTGEYRQTSNQADITVVLVDPDAGRLVGSDGKLLLASQSRNKLTASLDFSDSTDWRLKFQTYNLTLDRIAAFLDIQTGGQLTSRFTGRGTPNHPRLNGSYSLFKPWYETIVLDSITGQATLENGLVSLQSARLQFGNARISIDGNASLPPDPADWGSVSKSTKIKLALKANRWPVDKLIALATDRVSGRGLIDANLKIAGTVGTPEFSGLVQLKDGFLTSDQWKTPLQSLQAEIHLAGEAARPVTVAGVFGSDPFTLSGEIGWHRKYSRFHPDLVVSFKGRKVGSIDAAIDKNTVSGEAELQNFDLAIISPFLPEIDQLSGFVDSKVKFNGTWSHPRIRGDFRMKSGTIRISKGTSSIDNLAVNLSFENNQVKFSEFTCLIEQIPVSIGGYILIPENGKSGFDLSLTTSNVTTATARGQIGQETVSAQFSVKNLNLALFEPLLPDIVNLSGSANGGVAINGLIGSPRFAGALIIRNINFLPRSIDVPVTEGSINLAFDENAVILDSLRFTMAKGSITGHGRVEYAGSKITNLLTEINIKNIAYRQINAYQVSVRQGKITCRKKNQYYNIDGDINLAESRLKYNIQPRRIITTLRQFNQPEKPASPILRNLRLNVRIRESDNLWIDNNLARLRLSSELSLIGTVANPSLSGKLAITDGYLLYLDRKFKVTSGTIIFSDPYKFNPNFNFKAVADIKSYQTVSKQPYKITLLLNGDLDHPTMDLVSDPPLDTPDILSILTLGGTRQDLTGRDGGQSGTVLTTIQKRLEDYSSQKISSFASQRVGAMFGLEEVTIEGNLFTFGSSWGPELVASKKLSDNTEITYVTKVGHMNDQAIRLTYKLTESVSVEGQTDQKGNSGVDLKYQIKFK